ncbi:MAG: hypothetical protein JO162_13815 [Alphaproteobacteria bacterium]|nr:hypothetical protein [Alphaproteobacteria bacterium]
MRTRAQPRKPVAQRRAAAAAPAAKGRRRVRAEPEAPVAAADTVQPVAVTAVRMVAVEEGLYALRIGEIGGDAAAVSGMQVPAAQVSAPFAEDGSGPEIVASFPRRGPWLGREGGTVIIRSSAGGGHVIVTAYGQADQPAIPLSLDLQRLDALAPTAEDQSGAVRGISGGGSLAPQGQGREVPTEILLHIERAGDRLFPGRGWVGALGRKLRIEAFSIRPLEAITPGDIELKGFLPRGGETQWVQGGLLCGTRGRRLPLTGFAVRLASHLSRRFDVVYQGSFFSEGISAPQRNGQPCRAAAADDPLEAINIRIVERAPDTENAPAAD